MESLTKRSLLEAIGTFFLVLAGTGAIVLTEEIDWPGHMGISLAFGLIVFLMIMLFGKHSGAHINPAVTIAFWLTKRIETKLMWRYIVAQLFGATLASILLYFLFPANLNLGSTLPQVSTVLTIAIELFMTFLLVFIILYLANKRHAALWIIAVCVGALIFLEAYFGGPYTGASMNPARSFGPAIVSGQLISLWIYFFAPIAGALLAIPVCKVCYGSDCC